MSQWNPAQIKALSDFFINSAVALAKDTIWMSTLFILQALRLLGKVR